MRWSVFQVARKHRCGFLQLFLQLPLELACARNATRPRAVPEGSIRRMDRLFEPPNAAAHAWEEPTVLLDSSGSWEALAGQVRARLLPAVRSAYRCPPEPKAELSPEELAAAEAQLAAARAAAAKSVLSNADLQLRKLVGVKTARAQLAARLAASSSSGGGRRARRQQVGRRRLAQAQRASP